VGGGWPGAAENLSGCRVPDPISRSGTRRLRFRPTPRRDHRAPKGSGGEGEGEHGPAMIPCSTVTPASRPVLLSPSSFSTYSLRPAPPRLTRPTHSAHPPPATVSAVSRRRRGASAARRGAAARRSRCFATPPRKARGLLGGIVRLHLRVPPTGGSVRGCGEAGFCLRS
jgi:hypothetical protein